ncbi:MAG TPA: DinB family protein [Candidatus Dormibacteraeota bacterium]|nr:DinB family protein [Candidatus Dormibacteraeota bacterium]
MNADAFRHLFDYHFNENSTVWDKYVTPLSDEQFTQEVEYSHGSIRNQIVHLMNVDEAWFTGLRGVEFVEGPDPASFVDRDAIRSRWDVVEQQVRDYLSTLRDDMLLQKPFAEGEDKDLILWQVLIQVANHGTDHRAQLLRLLNDLGVKTVSQDYIFFAYDHPVEETTARPSSR